MWGEHSSVHDKHSSLNYISDFHEMHNGGGSSIRYIQVGTGWKTELGWKSANTPRGQGIFDQLAHGYYTAEPNPGAPYFYLHGSRLSKVSWISALDIIFTIFKLTMLVCI